MMKKNTKIDGFTVLEFLLIVVLMTLVGGLFYLQNLYTKNNALYEKRLVDVNQFKQGLSSYQSLHEKYPTTSGTWYSTGICVAQSANITSKFIPDFEQYIPNIPRDPNNATDCLEGPMYMYKSTGHDYKMIVYNSKTDVDILLKKNPAMVDPVRSSTSSTPSFGVWSPGGASY